MRFQPLHQFVIKGRTAAGGAESTITRRAASAARDLRQFGRIEMAELIAVEFAVGGKRNVIDVRLSPMPTASVAIR